MFTDIRNDAMKERIRVLLRGFTRKSTDSNLNVYRIARVKARGNVKDS